MIKSVRLSCEAAAAVLSLTIAAAPAVGQEITPRPNPTTTPSLEQTAPEDMAVAERPSPEYDADGFRIASYVVKPGFDIGETFNSNILGSQTFERSDFITVLKPSLDIVAQWPDDALAFHAEGDIERYARYTSENVNNMLVRGDGRIDISRGQTLNLGASYEIQHEDRYSPESLAAVGYSGGGFYARYPTEYSLATWRASYDYAPRRLGFGLSATVNDYQYNNEPTFNGGLSIQSDLSRREYILSPSVSYEISPQYTAFVQGWGNFRKHDAPDGTPQHFNRNSAGYAIAAGAKFDIDRVITGQAYVGFQNQMYDDRRLSSNSGVYLGASVQWKVTRLTTVNLTASRGIQETILIGSSGYFDTQVGVSVDHEFLRNVILSGGVTYERQNYQGVDLNDTSVTGKLGARWRFAKGYSAGLSGAVQRRWSNQPFNSFTQAIVGIDIKASF